MKAVRIFWFLGLWMAMVTGAWAGTVQEVPKNLTATDGKFTDKVQVTWKAVKGAEGYLVYRWEGNEVGAAVPFPQVTGTSLEDTTAESGTVYTYWVRTVKGGESGEYSKPDTGFVKEATAVAEPAGKVEAPKGLSASDGTSVHKVQVTWKAVKGAQGYVLRRASSGGPEMSVPFPMVTGTAFDDTTAEVWKAYRYWVTAVANGVESKLSKYDDGYRGRVDAAGGSTTTSSSGGIVKTGSGTLTLNGGSTFGTTGVLAIGGGSTLTSGVFTGTAGTILSLVMPQAGEHGAISPSTTQYVAPGGSVAFTATPESGYVVDAWLVGDAVAQTGGTSFTLANVTGNKRVKVTFKVGEEPTPTPTPGL